ncbi:hypothetical protein RND71_023393 [Anisodus tanguticus]|uniref:Uncharacterized protein n=1 Tax=Anisodus tanguticus TaxID=243964 RepID=A0AAE1RVG7_9SOLA|nr:hypothetical protein RND71_023393 [Anisodus tanguticus]
MGTKTKKKQNKLVKYIVAPFKVLGKAREFYMKTVFDCAQQVGQGGSVMTCTIHHVPHQLPKSRELKKQTIESNWRSYSIGVGRLGRIDENKPCDFKELDVNMIVYPRSRSYAIVNRARSRI